MTRLSSILRLSLLGGAMLCAPAIFSFAHAGEVLMGKQPWGFSQTTSRASIAALQMQHDGASGGGGGSAFACGGGGTATSTANYTCIIINNSDGTIVDADQDSTGDQTSNTNTQTTANGVPQQSLSDVLESLQ